MSEKNEARLRRSRRGRAKMRALDQTRLCVHRTPRHIYAQIIAGSGDKVLASASTLEKANRASAGGNITAAASIGKLIAERAKQAGITTVAFDRAGYRYHGRVKALAEAARENGLEF